MTPATEPATESQDSRYPIGPFQAPEPITREDRRYALQTLAEMPEQMREAVRGLDDTQLDTPYRDNGWTVRQVVHHVADSHMTAFHRFRKALTEDWPAVPGYNEKAFATLADASAPAEWSLELLEALHARWVMMLHDLTDADWKRGIVHGERGRMTLDLLAQLYAWHSRHHTAHITSLRTRKGW